MSCSHCDYNSDVLYTWCTNCGNYGIHGALKDTLVEMEIPPERNVLCFDIGCHGNGADKIKGFNVHGLHGRVIPFACGVAIGNGKLNVIAFGGDGATLGEGINHLIHAIRSDYNITFFLHDNENYGLTTGQASPTTKKTIEMNSSPEGVVLERLNVMDLVFSLGPTFVARGYSGNGTQLKRIMSAAMQHDGFSFVQILQDCPTYNKATPHEWFMKNTYDVGVLMNYDKRDMINARKVASDIDERMATGILYQREKGSFMKKLKHRDDIETSLTKEVSNYDISEILKRFV